MFGENIRLRSINAERTRCLNYCRQTNRCRNDARLLTRAMWILNWRYGFHARSSLLQLAAFPRGGLTPAEAPLIDAEILFRQPQPPNTTISFSRSTISRCSLRGANGNNWFSNVPRLMLSRAVPFPFSFSRALKAWRRYSTYSASAIRSSTTIPITLSGKHASNCRIADSAYCCSHDCNANCPLGPQATL